MNRQRFIWSGAVVAAAIAGFFLRDPILQLIHRASADSRSSDSVVNEVKPDTSVVRSLTGTLRIEVPEGIIGTDYWIYVNEHLVSAPPREATTHVKPGDLQVSSGPVAFLVNDQNSKIMQTDGPNIAYLRDDMKRDAELFSDLSLPVAPGRYQVALMTRASGTAAPFSVLTVEASVDGGQQTSVRLAIPPNFVLQRLPLPRAASRCDNTLPDQVRQQQRAYSADPIAKALIELDEILSSNPPQLPVAIVQLPPEFGGSREYNARQIDEMIAWLKEHYELAAPDCSNDAAAAGISASQAEALMDDFNRRIEALSDISRKLREADAASKQ